MCGNYGFQTNQINGQSIKTRVLTDALVEILGVTNVRVLDSAFLLKSPIRFFLEARNGFKECSQVIMMPGTRGLHLFLPLFVLWKQQFDRSLKYVVIGGWLPDLLERNGWLRHLCTLIDGVYVETATMAKRLVELKLPNVVILPNFRKFTSNLKINFTPIKSPIKLVFYSRVIKEKGIEDAISAVLCLNAECTANPRVVLDVYGPLSDSYQSKFQSILNKSNNVSYRGVLEPLSAYEVLQKYDLMIFPSYYEGEGFPGALLDAYIAGLPVIASDWKYNSEIIEEGRTGFLFKVHAVEEIVAQVNMFIENPSAILQMRQHCIKKAQNYHVENVVEKLLVGAERLTL